ncbi:MAG TPA: hypothetical protein VGC70_14940, partial [Burkholderiales bacterium]
MDFTLREELRMLRDTVARFVKEELIPRKPIVIRREAERGFTDSPLSIVLSFWRPTARISGCCARRGKGDQIKKYFIPYAKGAKKRRSRSPSRRGIRPGGHADARGIQEWKVDA